MSEKTYEESYVIIFGKTFNDEEYVRIKQNNKKKHSH